MSHIDSKKKYLRPALWLCLAALFAYCVWYLTTPVFKGSYTSPRHVYRLEYYDVSPIKRLIHYDMKIPSFVRLYRIEPETLMGESDVADLWISGQLYWWLNPPVNAVQIGRDIVFLNVPPECTGCSRVPDSAVKPDPRLKSPLVGRLPFMVVTPSAKHEGRSQVKIVSTGLIKCLTVAVSRAEVRSAEGTYKRSLWASA